MAKKSTETTKSIIQLVIDGKAAQTSVKELGGALSYVNTQLRQMKANDPKRDDLIAQKRAITAEYQKQKEQIGDIRTAWQKFKGEFGVITKSFMAGSAVLAGGSMVWDTIIESKNAFKNYEKAAAGLQSATLMSKDVLEQLKNSAKSLDGEMGYTSEEYLKAATKIGSAKSELVNSAEAMDLMVQKAMLFARAGNMDLPEAGEALSMMLNQFGKDANEAGHFVDVLAQGFALGAAELPQMVNAMKYAGVVSSQFNVSFGETNAMLQLFVKNGLTGEMAGTQLRSIILALGTGADETNPKIVGLEKALENLVKKNMTAAEQEKLFGKENIAGGLILLNNLPILKEWTKRIEEKGAAEKMAAINMNTLDQAEKNFGITAQELYVLVGEKLSGAFRSAYESGIDFLKIIKDIILNSDGIVSGIVGIYQAVENLVVSIAKLTSAFTGLNTGGEFVTFMLKRTEAALKFMAAPVMFLTIAIREAVNLFGVLMNKGREVMNFFGAEFKLNPKATMDNLIKEREKGIDQLRDMFKTPIKQQKNKDWHLRVSTGGYSGENPIGGGGNKSAGGGSAGSGGLGSGSSSGSGSNPKKVISEAEKDLERLVDELKKIREEAEIEALKGAEREIAQVQNKYQKLRELAHGHKNKLAEIHELEQKAIANIHAKYDEEFLAEKAKTYDANIENLKAANEQYAQEQARAQKLSEDLDAERRDVQMQMELESMSQLDVELYETADHYLKLFDLAKKHGLDTTKLEQTMWQALENVREAYRQKDLDSEADAAEKKKNMQLELFGTLGDAFYSLFEGIAGNTEEFAVFQKTAALFQLTMDTASAISTMTAKGAAMSITPIDAAIKIAAGIAVVAGNIAKARAILSSATQPERPSFQRISLAGRESGGFAPLALGADPAGYVDRPTLFGQRAFVAGEGNKREYIVPWRMMQDPVVADMVGMIESVRPRYYSSAGNASAAPAGLSMGGAGKGSQMSDGLMIRMIEILTRIEEKSDREIDFNFSNFERKKERLNFIRKDTSA